MGPGDYGLLLFEESCVKTMDFGPRLAKITTWSFLIGLEEMGVIPSAEDFHRDIPDANRIIPKDPFEHSADVGDGREHHLLMESRVFVERDEDFDIGAAAFVTGPGT